MKPVLPDADLKYIEQCGIYLATWKQANSKQLGAKIYLTIFHSHSNSMYFIIFRIFCIFYTFYSVENRK